MPSESRSVTPDGLSVVERFADPEALAAAAEEVFREVVESAVASRGRAAVALSGGSTPARLFRRLARPELAGWSAWKSLHFFWADERVILLSHADSNFRLASDGFLSHVPVPVEQIHPMPTETDDLEAAAESYGERLASWGGSHPARLDLILLGLGDDAHTASLFPGSPALAEIRRAVVASPGPPPYESRLTMTLPFINAARRVVFLVSGESKAEAIRRVLTGDEAPSAAPARGVRPDDGELLWLLDQAAASRLPAFPGDSKT